MNPVEYQAAYAALEQRSAEHKQFAAEINARKNVFNARMGELSDQARAAEREYLTAAIEWGNHNAAQLQAEYDALERQAEEAVPRQASTAATPQIPTGVWIGAACVIGAVILLFTDAGPSIFALVFVMSFLIGIPALIIKKLFSSGGRSSARPTYQPQATTVQDQALAQAQEREQQAAAEADRIRAEAEQRRAAAIQRAQQQTTTDSDWD